MLNKLAEIVNEIAIKCNNKYDINSGGCCFFASLVAKYLSSLGIKYKLVIYDNQTEDAKKLEVRRDIRSGNKNTIYHDIVFSASHYAIELENGKIINGGDYDDGDRCYMSVAYIPAKRIKWMYDNGEWNHWYKRKKYNPIVGKLVKQAFNRYEQEVAI